MLDVFLKQRAVKVIVGDTHQQIYGWRYAVNSLEKVAFDTLQLSASFRFGQDIAELAKEILRLKKHISGGIPVQITGNGVSSDNKTRAVLARTNLGLLLEAIKTVADRRIVKRIYFEGNIHSYTYADDGASLYDVLNLYSGKRHLIRDKLILSMKNLDELEDYIEKTEDAQLGMLLSIVEEYGEEIPEIIKEIKEKHVGDHEREKAELIFSTVHRSKGMEYDTVRLVNDFITEEKLKKLTDSDTALYEVNNEKLNEEINMLYVAVTRAKNTLYIPCDIVPAAANCSAPIHVADDEQWYNSMSPPTKAPPTKPVKDKAYNVEEVRKKHTNAYKPWTPESDDELTMMYCEDVSIKEMAKHFGRNQGSILSRIKKLELEEKYG
jgi:superfamily I DNA/RNA helicase